MSLLLLQLRLLSKQASRLLADQRGQATVEYSTITFMILIGVGVAGFAVPMGPNQPSLAQALYSALQTYVNSVNFSLSLAAP